MVTRQREHQVTCSGSDSPSLLALPDPEHEGTKTLRNVGKHTSNRIAHGSKLTSITPSIVPLGLPFLQVFNQNFYAFYIFVMRATRPPVSREVPIPRQTDRQTDRQRPPQNVAVPSSLCAHL